MRVKILMAGFGHVGQGFAELLLQKRTFLSSTFGLDVRVIGIVTGRRGAIVDPNGLRLDRVLKSVREGNGFEQSGYSVSQMSAPDLIKRLDFDVLTELTVTDLKNPQPATEHIRLALQKGRSVITANKGPIALHLKELEALAKKNDVALKYEGTVLSGTPLINLIQMHLAGAEILEIQGIVNGSTNYILTRMEEGLEYDDAVAEAKELGYLEADPTADVEGWDAVAKAMILARAIFGTEVGLEQVERKGISTLRRADIQTAKEENKVWKLIARVQKDGEILHVSVRPEKLKDSHPLAAVKGAMNAVTVYTDCLGAVTITGPGAGGWETGFAVLNDLISIFR